MEIHRYSILKQGGAPFQRNFDKITDRKEYPDVSMTREYPRLKSYRKLVVNYEKLCS